MKLQAIGDIIQRCNPHLVRGSLYKIINQLDKGKVNFYVKKTVVFQNGLYTSSYTDLQLVHSELDLLVGAKLLSKGYMKFGPFTFLNSGTKNAAMINEGYKQALIGKPHPEFQRFPLDNSQSQKGLGLDTGVLSRDGQGQWALETWEAKWHFGSNYSGREAEYVIWKRFGKYNEKLQSVGDTEELYYKFPEVRTNVEQLFKDSGHCFEINPKEIQLIRGLWSTLHREEHQKLLKSFEENPHKLSKEIHEIITKNRFDKAEIDSVTIGVQWSLPLKETDSGSMVESFSNLI